jgi:hypothetical protein
MAYVRTSMDGRNEGKEGVNGDIPEEGLGLARLMVVAYQTPFPNLQPQSGEGVIALLEHGVPDPLFGTGGST